jgi:hypothetical protein
MRIWIDFPRIRWATGQEYVLRFLFGGLVTALAALIAQAFGAIAGGTLLAFPALSIASTTLAAQHEIREKRAAGVHGHKRARKVAAIEAAGAALGSIGLLCFALAICWGIEKYSPSVVISGATLLWLISAAPLWYVRKSRAIRHLRVHYRRRDSSLPFR